MLMTPLRAIDDCEYRESYAHRGAFTDDFWGDLSVVARHYIDRSQYVTIAATPDIDVSTPRPRRTTHDSVKFASFVVNAKWHVRHPTLLDSRATLESRS